MFFRNVKSALCKPVRICSAETPFPFPSTKGALPHLGEKWRARGGSTHCFAGVQCQSRPRWKKGCKTLSKSKELTSQLKLQLGSQCLKPKVFFPERLSANGVKQARVGHGCCCGSQSVGSGAADVGQSWLPLLGTVRLCSRCVPWYSFCAVPEPPSWSAGYSISYLTSPKSCYFCLPSVLTVYIFSLGLKTYLISGQKVKEPHCSCSQALLPSLEAGDGARMQAAPSAENAADSTKALKHVEKPKVSACFRELRLRPERAVDGETSPVCF